MRKYGLLLSHDPSIGAFEAGAWQAIRQMNLPLACVCGGGLNVLNAALMAQNDPDCLFNFWHTGIINHVMQLNAQIVRQYINNWADFSFRDFKAAFNHALFNGTFKLGSLRNQLSELIDESKIRQSNTQLFFTIPDWNNLELKVLSLEKIPSGQLTDYLLRCIALPVMHQNLSLDPHDNSTISVKEVQAAKLIEHCSELLSFESTETALRKKLKKEGIVHTVIMPSIYLAPCSSLEQPNVDYQMKIGFLDCLKAFDLVCGKKYYIDFNQNHVLYDHFSQILGTPARSAVLNSRLAAWMALPKGFSQQESLEFIAGLVKKSSYRKEKIIPLTILEVCAQKLKIENNEFHSADAFIDLLFDQIEADFSLHLKTIRQTGFDALMTVLSDETDFCSLTLPLFLSFYTYLLSPAVPISSVTCHQIRKKLLPEDQLALLGLIYLNLMVKAL